MPESSLIFVVIVAIWAAFLIQHWVRRRESAAATRSLDHFSDDMRVLDTRAAATVTIAHATPGEAVAPRPQSPLVARRPSTQTSDLDEAGTMTPAAVQRPGTPRTVSLGQRRLRAVLLLLSLLWVPVSVTLVVMGRLMWVSIPLALLTVVAVLFWLRTEARAERARQAATRRDHAPVRRRRPVHAPVEPAPELTSDDTQVIRDPARYAEPVEAELDASAGAGLIAGPAVAHAQPASAAGIVAAQAGSAAYLAGEAPREEAVFDLQAEQAAELAALPVPEIAEGTWSPVPVPAPTYTMKAKAEPRLTESGIPADVFDTPEFADEVAELDERALFARRAASQ